VPVLHHQLLIELVQMIVDVVAYKGRIKKEVTKPDWTPRMLLDVSRLNKLGWHYSMSLEEGIGKTYQWFLGEQRRTLIINQSILNVAVILNGLKIVPSIIMVANINITRFRANHFFYNNIIGRTQLPSRWLTYLIPILLSRKRLH
jgi:hypothetical protein